MRIKEISITTLVLLVAYGIYAFSLQRQIQETVSRASSLATALRTDLESASIGYGVLREADRLLAKVALFPGSLATPELEDDAEPHFHSRLDSIEEKVALANRSRRAYLIWELRRAVREAKEAETSITALDREVRSWRAENERDLVRLHTALLEEMEPLAAELRAFHYLVSALLARIEIAQQRGTASAADADGLRKDTFLLAQVARIVYTHESLVGKRQELGHRPENLFALVEAVEIQGEDKERVRKARVTGQTPVPALPRTAAVPTEVERNWQVASLGLNVRQGPARKEGILCALTQGESVGVLTQSGFWWQVATRCGTGWVAGKYLKES